jgi:Domain of unknown function (DUF4082)/Malectin domain/Bacterial Ig-like domain
MRRLLLAAGIVALLVGLPSALVSAAPSAPPDGVTAIALDARVELAWQPVADASAYTVYRGTTRGAITTRLTPAEGVAATTYADTTPTNGTTYFYAVRAVSGGTESANSAVVEASPSVRSCSAGNAVVLENCFGGWTTWRARDLQAVSSGGIEGYATRVSIDNGESVDLKVNSGAGAPFRIEIYRSGYYGGDGARRFATLHGFTGVSQPPCARNDTTTGLIDCSAWSVSATVTTTASWPSGIYLLRLVREDTGADNHILLIVRDDARNSQLLYGAAISTYQAYNGYGGKSLYDFNSIGPNTVSGTPRAVKVSYDRPYSQTGDGQRDWYPRADYPMVYWLEREGFDVAYQSGTDMERSGARVRDHRAYLMPAHDEYYSAAMRTALEQGRDAGVSIFSSGSNQVYWRVRFENSPSTGAQDRILVCYKTTQSGGPDPSGIPTTTWRDPAGANNPENALLGSLYVGDSGFAPIRVSAAEGSDRIYRNTPLASQAPGTTTSVGTQLVGWEWDARVANGAEPPGVKTLASSPVTGELIQNHGRNSIPGSTTVHVVKYTASSGALVFNAGTNFWARGLARNDDGLGEPDLIIQQTTTNVLADMGVLPETPSSEIVLDNPANRPPAPAGVSAQSLGTDSVAVTWNAVPNAQGYHVYRTLTARDGGEPLGQRANASLVTGTTFTDFGLDSGTTYYYVVTAVAGGTQSLASNEATATTAAAPGQATRINVGGPAYTSATGQLFRADTFFTGGSTYQVTSAITGTNDPDLYRNERWGSFSYAIPVTDGVYDVRLHFAELYWGTSAPGGPGKHVFSMDVVDTPGPEPDVKDLDLWVEAGPNAAHIRTIPGVDVTDGSLNIQSVFGSADTPQLVALEVVPQSIAPPTVTGTTPAGGATGVSTLVRPTASFSRAMDATTINAASFTLTGPGGSIGATVSYDAATRTAELSPSNELAYSTTYTARLATSIKAADGAPLAAPVAWSFTTAAPPAPQVTSTSPTDGATGISLSAVASATFSRPLDPATVTTANFTLTGPEGPVQATVAYDGASRTATLTPGAPLTASTTFAARVNTSITSADGTPLAAPVSWGFTTAATPPDPPTVTDRRPADSAQDVAPTVAVEATFSRAMDSSTISASSFTLTGPSGTVAAVISYDAATDVARLTPSGALAYSATYSARLNTSIRAADGTPLAADVSWAFTTAEPPPPPTVTGTSPVDAASYVARNANVTATFSRAMDASTLTASSFTLRAAGGPSVAATVSYDDATRVARLEPTGPLTGGADYAARIETSVEAADGTPLAAPVSWSFATATCPCTLFSLVSQPAQENLATRDGRAGPGPWSYELGVKVKVDEPMRLTAFRFWKTPLETGSHTGRLWTSSGVQLAEAAFATETASGWQQQALASPVVLQPGAVYIVSVNANAFWAMTGGGLANAIVSGPLRSVADGRNGVYGSAGGDFPTLSASSNNYFVDLEVVADGDPAPPGVLSTVPAANATGALRTTSVRATFSRPMDPATVTSSSFTLEGPGGTPVASGVTYDDATDTAVLTPSAPLTYATAYTARLSTAIRARDGKPLSAPATWSFTVLDQVPPVVTSTVPVEGSSEFGPGLRPRAQFSKPMDASTLTPSRFTLTGPGGAVAGAVSYDAATRTAIFTPTAALAAGNYTARLDGSIAASDEATLDTPFSWSFTVVDPAPPLTVDGQTPAGGATRVARDTTVSVRFSRSLEPSTLTTSSFLLRHESGTPVAADLAYEPSTRVATLTPSAPLQGGIDYTVSLAGSITAADATALAPVSWGFRSSVCPCSLFPLTSQPTQQDLPTQDGRAGSGPWSYELGVRIKVDVPSSLTAIRFYKSAQEIGSHVGRVWSADGTELAQVTFGNGTSETAAGWQEERLATPLALQPDTVYVVSVNANAFWAMTPSALAGEVVAGTLRTVADGRNGVFGTAGGIFPAQTSGAPNYFVDAVVVQNGTPAPLEASPLSPSSGALGVDRATVVRATFSRPIDPATLSTATFTLTGPNGPIAATVAYDSLTRTASLAPAAPLAYATDYTARVTTGIRGSDASPLAAAVQWSFTVADPVAPQVVATVPVNGADDVGPGVRPRAEFSKPLDSSTVNSSTFTLTGPAGPVSAGVAYDAATRAATLTPGSPLPSGDYTARLDGSITAEDDSTLGTAFTWAFTVVSSPAGFAVTARRPGDGDTGLSRESTRVEVTFNRSVDPATLNGTTFRLRDPGGNVVPATIAYSSATLTATLTPQQVLEASSPYTAELTTGVRAADGTALGAGETWSFSTSACPCSLFSVALRPEQENLSTEDGRGPGTWTLELGVKVTVDIPTMLTGFRFYKSSQETGTHTGRLWTASGVELAQAVFANETASGWQQQALATPVELQPNVVYVVSINANQAWAKTGLALLNEVVSPPLRTVADNQNGVFGMTAGQFPSQSAGSANYFADLSVMPTDSLAPAAVTNFTGTAGASNVELTWTNPPDADLRRVRVVRKVGGAPGGPNDGTIVCDCTGTSATDTLPPTDVTYHYAAYALDTAGNLSRVARTSVRGVDTIPPGPVSNFTAALGANEVLLSWQNPADSDLQRVRVVRKEGVAPNDPDDGTIVCDCTGTSASDSRPPERATYHYAAYAYDLAGNVSPVARTSVFTPDTTPPASATNLQASATGTEVALTWQNPSDTDFRHTRIVRKNGLAPASPADGTAVCDCSAASVVDPTIPLAGGVNHYAAFALDEVGNAAVPARTSVATPPTNDVYTTSFTDSGCFTCTTTIVGNELEARIFGGADNRDTAYRQRDFAGAGGWGGRVWARAVVRLPDFQSIPSNLYILQARDAANVVWELYARSDRSLRLRSPAGGLRSTAIDASTGVTVPFSGGVGQRLEVSALRNDSVEVRVDGTTRLTLGGLAGATTGNPRYLRAGIDRMDGSSSTTVRVYYRGVSISQVDWLGPFTP